MGKRKPRASSPPKKRAKPTLVLPEVPSAIPGAPEELVEAAAPSEDVAQEEGTNPTLPKLNESQNAEIRKLKDLLKQAKCDAIAATKNPNIFDVIDSDWRTLKYDDGKSLARILHEEEGWSASGLVEWVANSDGPISIYPLTRQDSRAFWMCLRYRYRLNFLKNTAWYTIDLPEDWLRIQLKSKVFGKKNATEYAKKLAVDIAYNQHMFHGKKDYWFQPNCEQLGYEISDNLSFRWRHVLLVVCADPALVKKSTENLGDSWGSNRGKVAKAFKDAVKAAEKSKKIRYPETFFLFKQLFPLLLKF